MTQRKTMTTSGGAPVGENQNSLTVGPRGPVRNWDMVGNNTPVFFVRDALKFSDIIHTQKRDPQTNLKSPAMMWDFWSLSPESLHQVTILFSDRGTPRGYRHMNGYSSHTFSLVNTEGQRVWRKWHFKTIQGIQNFHREEAIEMVGQDPDFSQRDLFEAIERGKFRNGVFAFRS